ncbi:MAG: DNA polymerase III subunit delta [Candidatus Magasanikiibacteriota bacterium]
MIIFLYGADTFRSRKQLKKMIEKFKIDRDPQGLNVTILDCEKEEPGLIMEQILSMPFLAEKRMVVLENLLSATKKGDLQEQILKRVEEKNLPEDNVYIFWEGEGKPKTKVAKEFYERLEKEKYAQEFPALIGAKLSAWIDTEIKEKNGKISSHALQLLVQNTKGDIWLINSLIEQLLAYKGNEEIQTEDVNLFLEASADDNIFNLVDAIVAGQSKQVYKMIREQYKIGKDPHYVFSMVLRQFRILLEMRDLFDREDNIGSNIMASKLELHPFVVKKSLPFVKKYNLQTLKNIYQSLLDFDKKIKTGQGQADLLLDLFVGRLSI